MKRPVRALVVAISAVAVAVPTAGGAMASDPAAVQAAPYEAVSQARERIIRCGDGFICRGTPDPDLMLGSGSNNHMIGRGGGDVLRGRGGSDFLEGRDGNDTLRGGEDRDYLEGGLGRDALLGGPGGDSYEVRADAWGRDSLVDTAVSDSNVNTGNTLYIAYDVVGNLVVDLAPGPGPEMSNTGGTSTVDWEAGAVDNVQAFGRGDDTISGNDEANLLAGFGGKDRLSGEGGDDLIRVDDGSGDDTVVCGETAGDNDVVYRDPSDPETGDPGDAVAGDCEVQEDPIVYEQERETSAVP